LTSSVTHVARLLSWGRTLARHGALLPIERNPKAPALVRRLMRIARLFLRMPPEPRYADALRDVGPAAIKLGQALATRPDLVGADIAQNLLQLQDRLPPAPFAEIEASLRDAFPVPLEELFRSIDRQAVGAASIAQVHRAVTSDGRTVAVKVLRPGIEAELARAIPTYEWAAAQLERFGNGEVKRLRPRDIIARFRHWTETELNLRTEGGAASELAEGMAGEPDFVVPAVDWARTSRRVLTIEWIDGIKLTDVAALDAAGLDRPALARTVVLAFLRQSVANGFFHADMHQGNLFAIPPSEPAEPGALVRGKVAAIDFGIMGRIDRRARVYLAEILYGLITGNYRRVAEIHFEAGYVPPHHSPAEFATALRAVGEPIRGVAVKDISIASMLEGLFAITRSFDMAVQPHLLLLQKTMVMMEGVALALDPHVNTWDIAEPFMREWIRDELGPEARLADELVLGVRSLAELPAFLRRVMKLVPLPGAAPPPLPLPEINVRTNQFWPLIASAGVGAAVALALAAVLS
jgi:ubiquinone biosynthesis protein